MYDSTSLVCACVIQRGSAWPNFKGTWDLPARIPAHCINPTGRSVEGLNRLKSWGFDPHHTGKSQPHRGSKNTDMLQDVGKQVRPSLTGGNTHTYITSTHHIQKAFQWTHKTCFVHALLFNKIYIQKHILFSHRQGSYCYRMVWPLSWMQQSKWSKVWAKTQTISTQRWVKWLASGHIQCFSWIE